MTCKAIGSCSTARDSFTSKSNRLLKCIVLWVKLLDLSTIETSKSATRAIARSGTRHSNNRLSFHSFRDVSVYFFRCVSIAVVPPGERLSVSHQIVTRCPDPDRVLQTGPLELSKPLPLLAMQKTLSLNVTLELLENELTTEVILFQNTSQEEMACSNELEVIVNGCYMVLSQLHKVYLLVSHVQVCLWQFVCALANGFKVYWKLILLAMLGLVFTVLVGFATCVFVVTKKCTLGCAIMIASYEVIIFAFVFVLCLQLTPVHAAVTYSNQYDLNMKVPPHSTTHTAIKRVRHARAETPPNAILNLRLIGGPNVGYCVMIALGSAPQELCMLVDTGSANTAVAGSSQDGISDWFHTDSSSTYTDLSSSISVEYTSGKWMGSLAKDQISLGNTFPFEAYFAVIDNSDGFFIKQATWVGILGLAYSSLVQPNSRIRTVWDTFRGHTGMKDVFSLQLCPPLDILVTSGTTLQGGWMVLGGVNHTMYDGDIYNTSIVEELYYNIIITNLTVGSTVIDMDCTEFNNDKAIIDSGTTDIFLPKDVYEKVEDTFKSYFEGGVPLDIPEDFWDGKAKLMWQAKNKNEIFNSFPSFYIGFSSHGDESEGFSLAITPQTYLRQISGTRDEISNTNVTCNPCDFFTFGIKPRQRGAVIGSNMMQGFYTIFDRENKKIGFAKSKCSYPVDCRYEHTPIDWEKISYTCAAITLPMGVLSLLVSCILRCRSRLTLCSCCCSCKSYQTLESADVAEAAEAEVRDKSLAESSASVEATSCTAPSFDQDSSEELLIVSTVSTLISSLSSVDDSPTKGVYQMPEND